MQAARAHQLLGDMDSLAERWRRGGAAEGSCGETLDVAEARVISAGVGA